MHLQVRKIALLDENMVLTPGASSIVYPADLKSLIYGKDLTGEVNKISYYYNIPASYVYTIFYALYLSHFTDD